MLFGFVVLGACYAVPTFLGRSAALGLGYGAATCWACFGMTKGDSPQVVKDVATYGGYLVAVVSAAALMRPRPLRRRTASRRRPSAVGPSRGASSKIVCRGARES